MKQEFFLTKIILGLGTNFTLLKGMQRRDVAGLAISTMVTFQSATVRSTTAGATCLRRSFSRIRARAEKIREGRQTSPVKAKFQTNQLVHIYILNFRQLICMDCAYTQFLPCWLRNNWIDLYIQNWIHSFQENYSLRLHTAFSRGNI